MSDSKPRRFSVHDVDPTDKIMYGQPDNQNIISQKPMLIQTETDDVLQEPSLMLARETSHSKSVTPENTFVQRRASSNELISMSGESGDEDEETRPRHYSLQVESMDMDNLEDEESGEHNRYSSTIIHTAATPRDPDHERIHSSQLESGVSAIIKSRNISILDEYWCHISDTIALDEQGNPRRVKDSDTPTSQSLMNEYTRPLICKMAKNHEWSSALGNGIIADTHKAYIENQNGTHIEWIIEVFNCSSACKLHKSSRQSLMVSRSETTRLVDKIDKVDAGAFGTIMIGLSSDLTDENLEDNFAFSSHGYAFDNYGNIVHDKTSVNNGEINRSLLFAEKDVIHIVLDYSDQTNWKLYANVGDPEDDQTHMEQYQLLFDKLQPNAYRLAVAMYGLHEALVIEGCIIHGATSGAFYQELKPSRRRSSGGSHTSRTSYRSDTSRDWKRSGTVVVNEVEDYKSNHLQVQASVPKVPHALTRKENQVEPDPEVASNPNSKPNSNNSSNDSTSLDKDKPDTESPERGPINNDDQNEDPNPNIAKKSQQDEDGQVEKVAETAIINVSDHENENEDEKASVENTTIGLDVGHPHEGDLLDTKHENELKNINTNTSGVNSNPNEDGNATTVINTKADLHMQEIIEKNKKLAQEKNDREDTISKLKDQLQRLKLENHHNEDGVHKSSFSFRENEYIQIIEELKQKLVSANIDTETKTTVCPDTPTNTAYATPKKDTSPRADNEVIKQNTAFNSTALPLETDVLVLSAAASAKSKAKMELEMEQMRADNKRLKHELQLAQDRADSFQQVKNELQQQLDECIQSKLGLISSTSIEINNYRILLQQIAEQKMSIKLVGHEQVNGLAAPKISINNLMSSGFFKI